MPAPDEARSSSKRKANGHSSQGSIVNGAEQDHQLERLPEEPLDAPISKRSKKAKGKQKAAEPARRDADISIEYWLELLKESVQDLDEEPDDLSQLTNDIQAILSQLDYSGPPAPATGDDTAALDAEVTKERRRLKRYTRAVEEHEGLLQSENDRLKSFRRSREAQEKLEAAEEKKKLHEAVKALLSGNVDMQTGIDVAIGAGLLRKQAEQARSIQQPGDYDPSQDAFLVNLAEKLEPLWRKVTKDRP